MASKRWGEEELSSPLRRHLAQIRACEESGETLKGYAARKGLSVHALYQAKKDLRKRGISFLQGPGQRGERTRQQRSQGSPRFVEAIRRIDVPEAGMAWRLRFPGGVVFESAAALDLDDLVQFLRRLSAGS